MQMIRERGERWYDGTITYLVGSGSDRGRRRNSGPPASGKREPALKVDAIASLQKKLPIKLADRFLYDRFTAIHRCVITVRN